MNGRKGRRTGEDTTIAPETSETSERSREAELIRGAQSGDRSRFEALYRLHAGRVYALGLRLTGRREAAEEMTQEVFVRAWQHLDRLRPEDGIAAWLKRVAVNLHINELRRHSRHGAPAELPADDRLSGSLPETRPGLDLETAIRRLPEASRTAYVLHDVLGYKHREIAELTGIAVGTAKTHVHRARGRLKRMLGR